MSAATRRALALRCDTGAGGARAATVGRHAMSRRHHYQWHAPSTPERMLFLALGRYGGINEDFVLVDGWENARPTARKRWSRVSVRRWYSRSSGERLRLGRAWSAGIGWRRAAVSGAKTRSKSFKKIRQTEYPSADKR